MASIDFASMLSELDQVLTKSVCFPLDIVSNSVAFAQDDPPCAVHQPHPLLKTASILRTSKSCILPDTLPCAPDLDEWDSSSHSTESSVDSLDSGQDSLDSDQDVDIPGEEDIQDTRSEMDDYTEIDALSPLTNASAAIEPQIDSDMTAVDSHGSQGMTATQTSTSEPANDQAALILAKLSDASLTKVYLI